jgi:peptidyl-prolyl cis-trans isomerase C
MLPFFYRKIPQGENSMKRSIGVWICKMAFISTFMLASAAANSQEVETPKDPVASVNGVNIPGVEFERELNLYVQQASQQGQQIPDFMLSQIKVKILDDLIDRELLYQESQKKNIEIDAAQVDIQLKDIKGRFANQAEFEKIIALMNLTESDVKLQIARNMAIRELIDSQIAKNVNISDEQTKAYYDANPDQFKRPEQVKASHILIKVESGANETQKAQARIEMVKIKQKLKNGEDFAALAKEYSQDTTSVNGGDLGYFAREQMPVKSFADAAFALKPREISDIVETPVGYHLIKVFDKRPETKMAFAEVKGRLNETLKNQKIEQGAKRYIENLKKNAKIEKYI